MNISPTDIRNYLPPRVPTGWLSAFLAVGSLLAVGIAAESSPADDPAITNQQSLVQSVLAPVKHTDKPAQFDSFQMRLDYIHENLYTDYNTRVERTDAYFGRVLTEHEQPAPSRFRLGLFFEVSEEDTTQFAFKPSFNAKIKLPNVQKHWNVFIDTMRPTDLPGKDPTEENNGLRVGVGALTHIPHISASAGVRLTWLPEAFLKMSWDPRWSWGKWMLMPSQSVFYETDDKFGEQTQLSAFRWFGKRLDWAAGFMTAGTWSQSTDGLEWEQTVKGGYVRELLEEKDRGHDIDRSDLARGTGLRYSLFGSDKNFTEHQFMLSHRRPLYKKWIYIEIDPGIKWRSEYNWRTDPFILVGLDFLFWGTTMK
ncbi:MAG: hypothetical protein KKG09_00555 [Verrucomicrobia bacterium]|nr:hypothetical protein [Verrucomicrobiota bacterium]MCG2678495.1 hypothetical protein [Kiritimatiellia bacterium]MBU4248001.1 hypothetical protein [Verrucomicrobiota bacterium]MBU4289588.1 hypothetical protein [Verrucomicrobiota bacterium]MBU4427740.1 hypothetical protein [Verrucomicrobiota bacterium]